MAKKSTTNGKDTGKTIPPEQAREFAWPALERVRANRVKCKARIGVLTKSRDSLREEIRQLGPGKTAKRLDLDHELVESLSELEYQRKRSLWLADRMEALIDDAGQGKIFSDRIKTDVTAEDIFGEESGEDPDQATLPVGKAD